jgi:hypothetical protein
MSNTTTRLPLTTCNTCNNTIPDPAEEWPDDNGAIICQECWEAKSSREWWAAVGGATMLALSVRNPHQVRRLHCRVRPHTTKPGEPHDGF